MDKLTFKLSAWISRDHVSFHSKHLVMITEQVPC